MRIWRMGGIKIKRRMVPALAVFVLAITYTPAQCSALKVWYDGYNEQYFDGMLPRNTEVTYGDLPGDLAVTFKQGGRFHIVIDKETNKAPSTAHLSLLHEACHLATWNVDKSIDGHGPEFRACIDRLYKAGALEGLL